MHWGALHPTSMNLIGCVPNFLWVGPFKGGSSAGHCQLA